MSLETLTIKVTADTSVAKRDINKLVQGSSNREREIQININKGQIQSLKNDLKEISKAPIFSQAKKDYAKIEKSMQRASKKFAKTGDSSIFDDVYKKRATMQSKYKDIWTEISQNGGKLQQETDIQNLSKRQRELRKANEEGNEEKKKKKLTLANITHGLFIANRIVAIGKSFTQCIKNLLKDITEWSRNFGDKSLSKTIDQFGGAIYTAKNALGAMLATITENILPAGTTLFNLLGDMFNGISAFIAKTFGWDSYYKINAEAAQMQYENQKNAGKLISKIDDLNVLDFGSVQFNTFEMVNVSEEETLIGKIKSVWVDIKDWFSSAWTTVKTWANKAWEGFLDLWLGKRYAIGEDRETGEIVYSRLGQSGWWDKIKSWIKSFWDDTVAPALKQLAKDIIQSIIYKNSIYEMAESSPELKQKMIDIGRKVKANANGGVYTKPTLGLVGEYSNAHSNPEIITPKSLMAETIREQNEDIISALAQVGKQVITAINEKNMNVSVGTDAIGNAASDANYDYYKLTGQTRYA